MELQKTPTELLSELYNKAMSVVAVSNKITVKVDENEEKQLNIMDLS